MPTKLPIYQIPENPFEPSILDAFLRVDEALSRLDERAKLSALQAAWSQRLLYRNACAAMHTQNCLVPLEDLVLLDGHAYSGTMYADLSAALGILKFWQTGLREDGAMLLRSPMPGEMPRPLANRSHRRSHSYAGRTRFLLGPGLGRAGAITTMAAGFAKHGSSSFSACRRDCMGRVAHSVA